MTRTSNGHNFHSIYINQQFSNALFSNNENPIEQSPKLLKNARRKTNCPMKPPTHSPSELQMRAIRPTTTHKARVEKSGPFSFQSYTRGHSCHFAIYGPICAFDLLLYIMHKKSEILLIAMGATFNWTPFFCLSLQKEKEKRNLMC